MTKVHSLNLDLNFPLLNAVSAIESFGGSWTSIEIREGERGLKYLKSIATVDSVGASTRIEGSKMTNDEIKALIFDKLYVEKLEERDKQEVLGYYAVLDIILGSYKDIPITENSVKHLHNLLLKHSEKDQRHRGEYKQHANYVEQTNLDGSKIIIFKTTAPGIETEDAMRALFEWFDSDHSTPPLIKTSIFVYEFLSIHPFKDGNGRLSRLLATLLLLKFGYTWIQYVSFEHEIEQRKDQYYNVLRECQIARPNEEVTVWVMFFMDCLSNIQNKLMGKLDVQKNENQMSPREKIIYHYIDSHPGCQSGEIANDLNIPLPTIKRILTDMKNQHFLTQHGQGAGSNYSTATITKIKKNIALPLNENVPQKEFILKNRHSSIEITKIILNPKFQWTKPDDWSKILLGENLFLTITCHNKMGDMKQQSYYIMAFNNPCYYEPVFTLEYPVHIPQSLWEGIPKINEFPIKVIIEVTKSSKFDVMLVYDAVLE